MKRNILFALIAFAFLSSGMALAQQNSEKKDWQERMKAEKIAFLTDCMELTSEEAQVFWPVYNKAEKEKGEAFKVMLDSYKALDQALKEGKTEAEINNLLSKYLEAKSNNEAVDNSYADEYLKVLPASKVAKLFIGEERFRRNQIHKLRSGFRPQDEGRRPGKTGGRTPRMPRRSEGSTTNN
ncbi:MAG: hypothetical protein IJK96_06700 [Bacteroidales bacterium]|nr:hypothetical protein [Bacteroidales bacterium]